MKRGLQTNPNWILFDSILLTQAILCVICYVKSARTERLGKDIQNLTTNNVAYMFKVIGHLFKRLQTQHTESYHHEEGIHIRFLTHIFNLAIKECMRMAHQTIQKIKSILNAIRSSVKQRNLYEGLSTEMSVKTKLPSLDYGTRWSSTFYKVKKAYIARKTLSAVSNCNQDTQDLQISQSEWLVCDKISEVLEHAAVATTYVSNMTTLLSVLWRAWMWGFRGDLIGLYILGILCCSEFWKIGKRSSFFSREQSVHAKRCTCGCVQSSSWEKSKTWFTWWRLTEVNDET